MNVEEVIGNYILGCTIGQGSTGKVRRATKKGTTEENAIKIINKSYFDYQPELKNKLLKEVGMMRLLNHSNLLQLLDCEETSQQLYIVYEYAAGGELFDLLVANGPLSPEVAMHFFREIIYALEYLHSHYLCHRDLRPENILLDRCNHIKLADFDFARVIRKDLEVDRISPHYYAPEVLKGESYDGRCADIWSAGVVLYGLITGRLPFDDQSLRGVIAQIKSGRFHMPDCPAPLQDLLSKLLCFDPETRISIQDIKMHPAFCLYSPKGYIFPSSLPLPNLNKPRDPSTVPSQYFPILKAIEYSDDNQIEKELLKEGRTPAKLLIAMLERTALPFHSVFSSEQTCDMNSEEFMVSPNQTDAIGGLKMNIGASDLETSLPASKMKWATDVTPKFIEAKRFEGISLGLEEAMAALQKAFTEASLEWAYVDPMKLFVRNKHGLTVMCIARPVSESKLELVLAPSSEDYDVKDFDFFVETVTGAISLTL